ncbi:MAG: NUDIX hydrolase [Candidatus Algichlamydia australiensis]|nr:NUDIX hydrolase [Chlamydiales bacterium]
MYAKQIYELIESISPLDEIEIAHKKDALDWIESGVELCRKEKPATPPKHLVSYAILLDSKRQKILLVDHKKALLWLPVGGHVDPGEHPTATAKRELQEELGVSLQLSIQNPLFLTVTETVGVTAGHIDVSLWYLFEANSEDSYVYDAGEFNEIQWFSMNDLPESRVDPHLRRFMQKLHSCSIFS